MTLSKINQKHFPVSMSIIDLLLADKAVSSSATASSGISSLKMLFSEAWEIVDEECAKNESAVAGAVCDKENLVENYS